MQDDKASLLSSLAACDETSGGGSSGNTSRPTCEVLADPSICWNVAVANLYDCVPDEIGKLSADRKTCGYTNGTVIEFQSPLPTTDNNFLPYLTVVRPDKSICAVFYDFDSNRQTNAGPISASLF